MENVIKEFSEKVSASVCGGIFVKLVLAKKVDKNQELDKVKSIVKNIMENTIKLSVPLVVDIETGNNLVDYFFACGVPPSICMNEEIYNFGHAGEAAAVQLVEMLKS